jgi:hypothetical protein
VSSFSFTTEVRSEDGVHVSVGYTFLYLCHMKRKHSFIAIENGDENAPEMEHGDDKGESSDCPPVARKS